MSATETCNNVRDIIENSASNRFQLKTSMIAGVINFIGSVFLNISPIISPYLKCEWQMSTFQVALTSSILFFGEFVGAFYWGKFGDIVGRKYPLMLVSFGAIYFSLLSAGSQSLFWFIATRFFVGQFISSIFIITMVYGVEFVKRTRRGWLTVLALIFLAGGTLYANAVAFISLNHYGWRIYTICIAAPLLLLLPVLNFAPESIRYLEVCGNYTEIVEIVKDMIKHNKTALMPKEIHLESNKKDKECKGSYIFMLQNYARTIVALCIIWICLPLTFYGFNFLMVYQLQSYGVTKTSDNSQCLFLSSSDLKDVTLINLYSMPFIFLCFGVMEKFGRRPLMRLCLSTFLLLYGMMLVFSLPRLLMKIVLFCGIGLGNSGLQFLYTYTLEMFPTFIRSTSVGFCATVGKLAAILTPFIFQYMIYWSYAGVMVLMSTLTLMSLIALCFLEETKGVYLS